MAEYSEKTVKHIFEFSDEEMTSMVKKNIGVTVMFGVHVVEMRCVPPSTRFNTND